MAWLGHPACDLDDAGEADPVRVEAGSGASASAGDGGALLQVWCRLPVFFCAPPLSGFFTPAYCAFCLVSDLPSVPVPSGPLFANCWTIAHQCEARAGPEKWTAFFVFVQQSRSALHRTSIVHCCLVHCPSQALRSHPNPRHGLQL